MDMQYTLGTDPVSQPFDHENIVEIDTKVDCGKINFKFIDEYGAPLDDQIFQVETDETNGSSSA